MLAKRLIDGLADVPHLVLNGDPHARNPGCVNISFAYVEGESLLMALKVSLLSLFLSSGRGAILRLCLHVGVA
jgi:cysteine desulfurase